MAKFRRDFLKDMFAAGALPSFMGTSGIGRAMNALLDQNTAQAINPDLDPHAMNFWSSFLDSDDEPVVGPLRKSRGGGPPPNEAQPVYLHFGPEGFKNAAELDANKLVPEGDVTVSVNTSLVKIANEDQKTFERLQNAQIRVDVAQKTGLLPILEAMAYTVVGGMRSVQSTVSKPKTSSKTAAKTLPTVQSISVNSDADWQKMQNIPLPTGEGRWALNLEAQKKDSIFCKVLQNVVKEGGMFAPMLGFPGIVMSALNSFNTIYGIMHSGTVSIIKGNPVRVFATQEAVQRTGSPGAVTGILLQSGTYILMPAKQSPPLDQFKNLTVKNGHVVPPETSQTELGEAAADTLKDVTYVSFDVEVSPSKFGAPMPAQGRRRVVKDFPVALNAL